MKKRTFSAEFKTKIVLEVLKGEKEISVIASETEKDGLYKKIGQLTTQVDWLKKKSEELYGPDWESKFTPHPKG